MEVKDEPKTAADRQKPGTSDTMEADPDADLITWMALRDEDENLAFRALEILYRRHGPLLLGWCEQKMGNIFGDTAEDFVNATFKKAFDRAETFHCPPETPPEEQTKRVCGWLFRILENLVKDSFKAETREREFRTGEVETSEFPKTEDFKFPVEDGDQQEHVPSRRVVLVREFLDNKISADDRDLLELTERFFDFGKGEPDIDPDLLKAVCQKMNLTPSGLRSRRKRLIERLQQYIEDNE